MHGKDRLFTPLLITLIFLMFTMALSEFSIVGLLENISQDMGKTSALVGLLVSAYSIAYVIGTPIMTSWASRYDEFKIILFLTVLNAIANVSMVFMTHSRAFSYRVSSRRSRRVWSCPSRPLSQ